MNNKFTIIVILIFFIGIVSLNSCKSDETASVSDTNTQVVVDEKNEIEFTRQNYYIPRKLDFVKKKEGFELDKFYPIGWSENGNFAYLYEPYDEATGYYYLTFEIKNMKNNETIWSFIIDEKDALEGVRLIDIWGKNKDKFVEILNKNRIVQDKKIKVENFPISENGVKYSVKAKVSYENDPAWGFDVISGAELFLQKNQKKVKTIFKNKFRNSYILNLSSEAYIKNTKSNEIAVIIVAEERGWEGPPNVLRINIAGCSLDEDIK